MAVTPVVYSIVHHGELADGTHRILLASGAILGVLIYLALLFVDVPASILMSFVIWRIVNITLLLYSWRSEKISPVLYITESLLGMIVLWRIMMFMVPVQYPGIAYGLVLLGSITIAAGLLGSILAFRIKIYMGPGGSLKVLYGVLLGALSGKLIWIAVSILLFSAEDVTGNIQLVVYLWTYAPIPFITGIVLGVVLPLLATGTILSQRLLNHTKFFAGTTFISLMIGEMFLKYLVVQFGFSF